MKRVGLAVLIICLALVGLFVSCKNEIEVPADELVSVGFSNSGSRALSSNLEAFNPNDYYWAYAAQKADGSKLVSGQTANYGTENEVTLWVKRDANGVPVTGLGDSNGLYQVPGFSQGLWNFKLYAFKDVSASGTAPDVVYTGDKLLYKGETTGVLLKSSTTNDQGMHSVNVIVSPVDSGDDGTLLILTAASESEHITMTLLQSYAPADTPVYGVDYFPRVLSIDSLEENPTSYVDNIEGGTADENGIISLPAGTYKVTFVFTNADDDTATVNYSKGSVIATVYSNLTTTIKGNLPEYDVYAEFTSNQSIDTVTSGTGSDAVQVATIAAAPSAENVDEPEEVSSSNVANTKSAKTTISSTATAVTVAEDKKTTVTIPAEGLADTVVTKTLTEKTGEENKVVTTVTQSSSHDLSMKVTDAEDTATPTTVVISAGSTKVAGVNLTLTKTTTTVTETATTTSGATVKETKSTTADPVNITSFNDLYVTVSTYISTGLVDVGVLYDGDSQTGLVFNANNSSPSVEVASSDDGNSNAGTGYNPTTGLLVFKTNHFSSYIVTCAPALSITNSQNKTVYYPSIEAFRDDWNSGDLSGDYTIDILRNINLSNNWLPIGTFKEPFHGTINGHDHIIEGLAGDNSVLTEFFTTDTTQVYGAAYGFIGVAGNGDVTVNNLSFTNVDINLSNGNCVGTVIGYAPSTSDFNSKAGGVGAGNSACGTVFIQNISVAGSVTAKDSVAGIMGKAYNSGNVAITGCETSMPIHSAGRAAGIVGYVSGPTSVNVSDNIVTENVYASDTAVDKVALFTNIGASHVYYNNTTTGCKAFFKGNEQLDAYQLTYTDNDSDGVFDIVEFARTVNPILYTDGCNARCKTFRGGTVLNSYDAYTDIETYGVVVVNNLNNVIYDTTVSMNSMKVYGKTTVNGGTYKFIQVFGELVYNDGVMLPSDGTYGISHNNIQNCRGVVRLNKYPGNVLNYGGSSLGGTFYINCLGEFVTYHYLNDAHESDDYQVTKEFTCDDGCCTFIIGDDYAYEITDDPQTVGTYRHLNIIEPVPFTVSFETQYYNVSVSDQQFTGPSKVAKPGDPVKDGYLFRGWYSDYELTTPFDFDNTTVSEDTTLYALWRVPVGGTIYYINDNNDGVYQFYKGTSVTDCVETNNPEDYAVGEGGELTLYVEVTGRHKNTVDRYFVYDSKNGSIYNPNSRSSGCMQAPTQFGYGQDLYKLQGFTALGDGEKAIWRVFDQNTGVVIPRIYNQGALVFKALESYSGIRDDESYNDGNHNTVWAYIDFINGFGNLSDSDYTEATLYKDKTRKPQLCDEWYVGSVAELMRLREYGTIGVQTTSAWSAGGGDMIACSTNGMNGYGVRYWTNSSYAESNIETWAYAAGSMCEGIAVAIRSF